MNTTQIQTDWIPRIGRGTRVAMASCVINHLVSGMYIQVGTLLPFLRPCVLRGFHAP